MLGKAAVLGLRAQQQNICQHVQAPELEPQHWKRLKNLKQNLGVQVQLKCSKMLQWQI